MIKSFFFICSILFVFSGCFSLSSLNPFSENKETKNFIEIPDNAPAWLKNIKDENYISTFGVSKIKKNDDLKFTKKKALIFAGNRLSQEIYSKTLRFYKDYEESLTNSNLFDKDLEKLAKEVSIKSLSKSIIKNTWIDENKVLYVKISISSDFVAQEIQSGSKQLFKVDKDLYSNILSNRAKEKIIKYLEE
ncbi:hypothetical protein CP965_08660 [Halarcobacter mediterraneus]|uniref:Uncharacterized protein n=1 Tax=Halarcobacter mediterraneus TaxID=2023153 RepID=A0A4Q1AYD6_9BACT|nr:hypothetical protein [Halarcobacter mediterraneus]RXK12640.1 hypothetical protein CP965_08660 [Halarcobacter mediterraneus]